MRERGAIFHAYERSAPQPTYLSKYLCSNRMAAVCLTSGCFFFGYRFIKSFFRMYAAVDRSQLEKMGHLDRKYACDMEKTEKGHFSKTEIAGYFLQSSH
ncbi:hypothetical protein CDAR_514141 [Caerostris darwini]|uniref:Uncharacterized protein n=1 Tax=Caerostris darwini TaxID=1538125 RepID=A0AAV4UNL7_9ARAC|nr:hypothetical protein CDAR_514141 [Caerostris darwini]